MYSYGSTPYGWACHSLYNIFMMQDKPAKAQIFDLAARGSIGQKMSQVCRKIEKIVSEKVHPYVAHVLKLGEVPKNFNQNIYKMFSDEGISAGHDQFYYVVYLLIVPFLFVHNNIFEVTIYNSLF